MTSCTGVCGTPFSDAEQTWPPGMASTSTMHIGDSRTLRGSSAGTTGRSLITESSPLPATRACAHDDPLALEREVRRVEEVHEPDLCAEGVDPQGLHGRALDGLRDRDLELDAVGALHH